MKSETLKFITKSFAIIALMVASFATEAQQYVFISNETNGYFIDNTAKATQTFTEATCVWTCINANNNTENTLGGTSRRLHIGDTYLRGRRNNDASSARTGSSTDSYVGQWRAVDKYLVHYNSENRYVYNNSGNPSWNNNTTRPTTGAFGVYTYEKTDEVFTVAPITGVNDVLTTTGTYNLSSATSYTPESYKYTGPDTRYYAPGITTGAVTSNSGLGTKTSGFTSDTWSITPSVTGVSINNNGRLSYTSQVTNDVQITIKHTVTENGKTKSAEKTITLQGTSTPTPTISNVEGTNNYTILIPTGATVKYTIDGTDIDATASNGNTYSTPITITVPNTVIKARAIRDGVVSEQVTYTVSAVYLSQPTINITTAGVVTMTNPNTFATSSVIRYTTDGSTPTSSSPTFSSYTATNMQTIKAIVTAEGYATSPVASKQYMIESGVRDGVVILNDYEDHNWSYYLPNGGVGDNYDYPSRLCSPYPRNVKITYHGNGPMYTGADGGTTTSTGSSVAVSKYESDSIFIYYKTLERDANNRFPYELIPNPFSKRPIYTSDATTKWRGFYGWRIKRITNGKVYDNGTERSTGYIFTTEYQHLAFQPTDNAKTNANNATSMEVEFEAVWARSYRVECNANAVSTNLSSGDLKATSYERNFVVVKSGTGAGINNASQKPVTVMMVEPDGSSDYRTNSSYIATTSNDIIAQNTLKIEWCNVRARYISANAKDMILGRGITYNCGNGSYGTLGTTNCASYVSGIGTVANTTGTNYPNEINHKFRIESGIYGDLNFTSRAGDGLRGYASGLIYQYCIVGNDYERASKDGLTSNNARLHIKNHTLFGYVCICNIW